MEDKLLCNKCAHLRVCVHRNVYILIYEESIMRLSEAAGPFKFTLHCRHFKESKPRLQMKLQF